MAETSWSVHAKVAVRFSRFMFQLNYQIRHRLNPFTQRCDDGEDTVVDDKELMRDSVGTMLSRRGHSVIAAAARDGR